MNLRACLLALLFGFSLPLQAATELIQLNYRMADEVLPLVQTALDGQGKASAYGNQLMINASPDKIAEIRDLLGQLDQAPRRLLISVDTSEQSLDSGSGYRVDGSISAGDAEVIAGRGEVNGRDQVRIIRRSTNSRGGGTQQVQATEGYPALIQVGQSVPVTSTSVGPYGQVYQNTQYRDVNQGFYVTATLSGDVVHLNISSNNDRVNRSRPDVIDTQSTDTRVSGRIGEWIPLGGVSQQNQSNDSGFARRYSTQGANDMSLRIKVDALD
ncbi:secretin N-terminal domain-containing protein [Pseudomonas sp. ML96]|uniref:secretin N-terminal domain-containing protein n=1 Tax=Pseudomonas sp. ML96 TaxID=1523503 RepID=UPI0005B8D803|nr:secretin N-terminal domain-containing protein [Pseudomonas sp. ML96]